MATFRSVLSTFALSLPIAAQDGVAPPEPTSPPLIVHEWGTFTSLQGSNGVVLEGLHHEEEALPEFVHDLGRLAEVGGGRANSKFPASRVTQKMETPVIYFHSEVVRPVKVVVTFLDGLMTQFYPLPELVAPPLADVRKLVARSPVDLAEIRWSCLEWDLVLTPATAAANVALPEVSDDDPWAEARRVKAAIVTTKTDPKVGRRAESERYLFYRGLGRFALPLRAVSDADGTRLMLDGEHAVPFAMSVEITRDGRGRFRELGALEPRSTTMATVDGARWHTAEKLEGALHVALRQALVEQGLYDDEARAMVATWSRQWFRSPGRRVLWIVPRTLIDRTLPLQITPTPNELVRVLVGRLEFLTPEVEAEVVRALADRRAADPVRRTAAEAALARLDRFLEPHVRRALEVSDSAVVRESAAEVLARVREQ